MSDFLNIVQDIKNIKYPDIVAKYNEIVTKTALALGYANTASAKADEAITAAQNASADATLAVTSKNITLTKADEATTAADEAQAFRDELVSLDPSLVVLSQSASAYLSYNSTTGQFIVGFPKGEKGDRGDAFTVDTSGSLASCATFDDSAKGFSYLALDETPTKIYFKASSASGDWTDGVAFGKGDKGETGENGVGILDISKTATVGSVDTYTITFTDTSETTFNIDNGAVSSKNCSLSIMAARSFTL